MKSNRRRFLELSAAAAVASIAGCSGQQGSNSPPPTGTSTTAETETPVSTTTATSTGGSTRGPPGADVLGGPNDLQSSVTVAATVLSEDEGAGTYVDTPAVVWLESGGTVTWTIEGGSHSVTAYHPDNDRPLRVPEDADSWNSGVLSAGETFEHTFETAGVYNYFCIPHESLGMVGTVVVGKPAGGPGTTPPSSDRIPGTAKQKLSRLLQAAGISAQNGGETAYGWQDSTWDSYWYSLYNMSTNISMSGNGVLFPHNEEQKEAFQKRFPAMLEAADQKRPPVKNPNLNVAPFTTGDPHFTQKPVFDAGDGRPDASTLEWDRSTSSKVVSPQSLAWTHLKGVTWAKNFQSHFDLLPDSLAPRFRSEVLSTLAQLGIEFSLVDGTLRANDRNMLLVGGWNPEKGVVDEGPRPRDHAAMLWFVSDLVSLATGGWFGYENPEPLIPPENIQTMADGVGKTVVNAFPPEKIVRAGSTRDLGEFLGAVGWYGTHAGSDKLRGMAADYANALANAAADATDGNGEVENGAANQAATQGVVGQGLVWASQIDGVDHTDRAGDVLGYLVDTLWDGDAGTFASSEGASTYTITARDAGDITGGLNAADAELGMDVQDIYARYFDETFNRGRLQRAERPPSHDPESENPLPLPPKAGGQYGQAAVYNAEVQYETGADEWRVTDPTFDTEQALYLANQDIWIGQWGGDFFQGRGVPGRSDTPE